MFSFEFIREKFRSWETFSLFDHSRQAYMCGGGTTTRLLAEAFPILRRHSACTPQPAFDFSVITPSQVARASGMLS
jgi:hypothetical protein